MRKLSDFENGPVKVGDRVILETRDGQLLEGFRVASLLLDQVMLEPPPLEGSDKQGFTIVGDKLKPNWCAGRRAFRCGILVDGGLSSGDGGNL